MLMFHVPALYKETDLTYRSLLWPLTQSPAPGQCFLQITHVRGGDGGGGVRGYLT